MSTGEHMKCVALKSQTFDDCQLSPHCLRSCCLWHLSTTLEILCVFSFVSASRRAQDEFYKGKQGQEQCVSRQPDLCTPGPGVYSHSYFVERNKMVGDAFCCYLMGSWECVRPQPLIWILHQIITGFCYLPHPVFLISTSTCVFCCLPQQHCTLQYQNTLIPGIVLLSAFLSFLWVFFPFSTILFQQSHSAAWDEASPLYITSQPWYHIWCIFCLSAVYDTQQQSLFQVFKRRHQ